MFCYLFCLFASGANGKQELAVIGIKEMQTWLAEVLQMMALMLVKKINYTHTHT